MSEKRQNIPQKIFNTSSNVRRPSSNKVRIKKGEIFVISADIIRGFTVLQYITSTYFSILFKIW